MKIFLLLLFWSLWHINFSAKSITSPLMPLIEDEFGISHAVAGVLFSGIIGPGLSPIILGAIADVWSFQFGILGSILLITSACILVRYLREV